MIIKIKEGREEIMDYVKMVDIYDKLCDQAMWDVEQAKKKLINRIKKYYPQIKKGKWNFDASTMTLTRKE